MLRRCSLAAVLICIVGCSEVQYAPADPTALAKVQSGTSLAKAVRELGEPHEPTSRQAEQMAGTLERMPQRYRGNAEADRTVAWGDDSAFVVGKVNSQGVIWVTAYVQGSGSGQPASGRGETVFRADQPTR